MVTPKGKLIIVGGSVDKGSEAKDPKNIGGQLKFFEKGILRRIGNESAKGNHSRMEIITTASSIPEEVGMEYQNAFSQLGIQDTGIINIRSREQANADEFVGRLQAA